MNLFLFSDPMCNVKTEPPTISTTATVITKSTPKLGPATQAARKSGSWGNYSVLY